MSARISNPPWVKIHARTLQDLLESRGWRWTSVHHHDRNRTAIRNPHGICFLFTLRQGVRLQRVPGLTQKTLNLYTT